MGCDVSRIFRDFDGAKAMAEQCVAEKKKTYHVAEDCVGGDEGGYFCDYKVAEGIGSSRTTFYPPEQYEETRRQLAQLGLKVPFFSK